MMNGDLAVVRHLHMDSASLKHAQQIHYVTVRAQRMVGIARCTAETLSRFGKAVVR